MLPLSLCRLWQPDRAANAAQDTRSYTTARGTIPAADECAWYRAADLDRHCSCYPDQQAGYISATSDSTPSLAKGSRSIHALANKLASIAWSVLRNGKPFDSPL